MPTRTERLREAIKNIADSDAAERQRQGLQDVPVGSSQNPSTKILTVANVITFCRLALTLVFLALFIRHEHRVAALACYAVAAVTDFLDGQIARRTQTVSWLGKIMDPVMDRILLFTGVLGLLFNDYLAIGGAVLQRYRKRPVDVVYIGKIATALLMFGFCDLLLGAPVVSGLGLVGASWLPGLNAESAAVGIFFVYAGCACSFATACVYTKKGLEVRSLATDDAA